MNRQFWLDAVMCRFSSQILNKMIIVKTEEGEFKYTKWQWNLAWFVTWLAGVIVGITCF